MKKLVISQNFGEIANKIQRPSIICFNKSQNLISCMTQGSHAFCTQKNKDFQVKKKTFSNPMGNLPELRENSIKRKELLGSSVQFSSVHFILKFHYIQKAITVK